MTLIPKEHLSLAETIVNVDKLIEAYNDESFVERVTGGGVSNYLVRKLKEKGIIKLTKGDKTVGEKQEFTLAMYNRIKNGMKAKEATQVPLQYLKTFENV
jgi:hypothetical protein